MTNQNQITFRYITGILLLLFAISGCSVLAPKKNALENVHNTYRNEFTQFMVPAEPGKQANIEVVVNETAFAKTLQEIREFRLKYGEGMESSHLHILEGMIYLQSGRFGMAKLVKTDIKMAASQLRSKNEGYYTRDYLLGMSYPYLIDGWQEIYDYNDNDDSTIPEYEKLETAAEGIEQQLGNLDQAKFSKPEVDQGAIYLATTAAIFYTWVYALQREEGISDSTNWFARGRDLIGKFLTENERKIAVDPEKSSVSVSGRLRYLDWYGYLDKRMQQ